MPSGPRSCCRRSPCSRRFSSRPDRGAWRTRPRPRTSHTCSSGGSPGSRSCQGRPNQAAHYLVAQRDGRQDLLAAGVELLTQGQAGRYGGHAGMGIRLVVVVRKIEGIRLDGIGEGGVRGCHLAAAPITVLSSGPPSSNAREVAILLDSIALEPIIEPVSPARASSPSSAPWVASPRSAAHEPTPRSVR